ncbi:MAG: hypothetical protein IPM47_03270 [Sphingobacteriales bacterium]|nr:MAG: hypothetical protein IPM47_03270 [Sphingobacteriales bacterium]
MKYINAAILSKLAVFSMFAIYAFVYCHAQTGSLIRLNDSGRFPEMEQLTIKDFKTSAKAKFSSQSIGTTEVEQAFKGAGGGCTTIADPDFVYSPANLTSITGAPNPLCGPLGTTYSSTFFQANGGTFDWQVWGGEVYQFNLIGGNTYTMSICGGAGGWTPEFTVVGPGNITISTATNCTITFTASQSGVHNVFITPVGACGTLVQQDNGHLVITLTNATNCTPSTCGNTVCDTASGESYCNCPGDCPCTISGTYVDFSPTTGNPVTSVTPAAFCENFVTGFPNPAVPEHTMFVPVAVIGVDCVTYNVSTTQGTLYQFVGEDLVPTTTIPNLTVLWLEVTQTQINASGGTTTVTFTGASGACNTTLPIVWANVVNYTGNVATTCRSPLIVGMFLEAAYNTASTDTTMNTTLNAILPLNSPYSVAPWNAPAASVTAMPTAVVDWVLVELRDPVTNALVASQAGLLSRFGYVFDTNLNLGLTFTQTGTFNIVIRHRNHLAVMSSQPADPDGIIVDFALSENVAGGTEQLSRLGTLELYALKAGDINANGVINYTDYNVYRSTIALPNTYNRSDANMDGNVNTTDFTNMIRPNTSSIGVDQVRY